LIRLCNKNIEIIIHGSPAFEAYAEKCLKEKTKGQVKIDIYNGTLSGLKGMFQKYKGANEYSHVTDH